MFENRYTISKSLLREYVCFAMQRNLLLFGLCVSILGFVSSLYDYEAVIAVVTLICLISTLLTPVLCVRQLMDMSKRLNGGNIVPTVVRFGDNIVMDEGKIHLEFDYSQITKIRETKHLYALMLGKNNAILVIKNGFTIGTAEEFQTFIRTKL